MRGIRARTFTRGIPLFLGEQLLLLRDKLPDALAGCENTTTALTHTNTQTQETHIANSAREELRPTTQPPPSHARTHMQTLSRVCVWGITTHSVAPADTRQ